VGLFVLNPKAFAQIACILSPDTIANYLQTIFNDGQAILSNLQKTEGSNGTAEDIATAVHKLAGGASMFGFERVAVLCRHLDRAIGSGAADVPLLADAVHAAIEGMLEAIQERSTPNSVIWEFERSDSDRCPLLVSGPVSA
jgi:HPt (histidine-containing phosphotransfer) domain-containing protein